MLDLKKKIWMVKQKELGKLTDFEIASAQKVTRMTLHRLWVKYKQGGVSLLENKQAGRPKESLPEELKRLILRVKIETGFGIRRMEGILDLKGVHIPHNKIHSILSESGLVEHNPKKGRRYSYVR